MWLHERRRGQATYAVPVITDLRGFYRNCRTFAGGPDTLGDGRLTAQQALGVCRRCGGAKYVKRRHTGEVVPCPANCWKRAE